MYGLQRTKYVYRLSTNYIRVLSLQIGITQEQGIYLLLVSTRKVRNNLKMLVLPISF